MTFTGITARPDQMVGVPCIRALRIPVATVVGMVAEGMAIVEHLERGTAAVLTRDRIRIRQLLISHEG